MLVPAVFTTLTASELLLSMLPVTVTLSLLPLISFAS
jgi:hypothetical protein